MHLSSQKQEDGACNVTHCRFCIVEDERKRLGQSHCSPFKFQYSDNLVNVQNKKVKKLLRVDFQTLLRGAFNFNPKNLKAKVTSVECSQCGNMAWIGCDDGSIREFNLQSGRLRKEYFVSEDLVPKCFKSSSKISVIC